MCGISIVIPAYKQARFLACAIDCALGQSRAAQEVIVVDDGSPDETPAICGSYGGRIVYIRKTNAGVSSARNTAILASKGDFIQFLDADDYLPPDTLAKHLANLADDPSADVLFGGAYYIGSQGERMGQNQEFRLPADPMEAFHHLLLGNNFPPHAAIVRRSALANAGLWDTQITHFEDWDMWLRLAFTGAKFLRTPELYVGYRQHGGSATQSLERMRRGAMQVLDKAGLFHPNCSLCRRRIRAGRWNIRQHFLRQLRQARSVTQSEVDDGNSRLSVLARALREDLWLPLAPSREWARRLKWSILSRDAG